MDRSAPPRGGEKITAAHLAGLRPRPTAAPARRGWDRSTAFVSALALATLAISEFSPILASARLLALLAIVGLFGIFPVAILHHLFLRAAKRATRAARIASALVALVLMFFATAAMRPIVGYDERLAEERRPRPLMFGEAVRAPASASAEAIRQGLDLYR